MGRGRKREAQGGGGGRGPERHALVLEEQLAPSPATVDAAAEAAAKRRRRKGSRAGGRGAEDEAGAVGEEEEDGEQALPADLGTKVLREARRQQRELEEEERAGRAPAGKDLLAAAVQRAQQRDASSDEEDALSEDEPEDAYIDDFQITAEDERAFNAFLTPEDEMVPQKTLADIIMEKFAEKERLEGLDREAGGAGGTAEQMGHLDPKLVEVYGKVGQLMSRYTTGKVPKAFKIIPTLQNWEDILWLTEPESWSPHATYQATRMFASNFNQKLAQRYYSLVLLPKTREYIQQHRTLHFAMFQALKKAMFKPAAFYKGILIPLCQSGTCTVREAVIFSSVLKRVSIPALHSSAAMLRLAEIEYSGTNSFFLRMLLDKKYALPYRVIDAMVDHFLRFEGETRTLPVVWHQCMLIFVQRYKNEIKREDKAALRKLLRKQGHYLISPEVFRELDHSHSRGERPAQDPARQSAAALGAQPILEDPREFPPILIMEEG